MLINVKLWSQTSIFGQLRGDVVCLPILLFRSRLLRLVASIFDSLRLFSASISIVRHIFPATDYFTHIAYIDVGIEARRGKFSSSRGQ